jgi:DNA-binding transcriptional ArsR family regulator
MLESLQDGPATASMLARELGESSGATSYHLRALAAAGLVVEDLERRKGRERWWTRSRAASA